MVYFTQEFINFFKELTLNNQKEWFDQNRKRYEKHVKEPYQKFISDLILAVQEIDPSIQITPNKAIFRINRDIRFSNDKTPYKVNRSAVLSKFNRKEEYPAYYIRIDTERLHLGGGLFSLSKESLYKVREEIMYNEKEFDRIMNNPLFIKNFTEMKGEKNKILRPPFKEAAEQIPILYNKQFYYMNSFSNTIILEEGLIQFIVEKYKSALSVNNFLQVALEEE